MPDINEIKKRVVPIAYSYGEKDYICLAHMQKERQARIAM